MFSREKVPTRRLANNAFCKPKVANARHRAIDISFQNTPILLNKTRINRFVNRSIHHLSMLLPGEGGWLVVTGGI